MNFKICLLLFSIFKLSHSTWEYPDNREALLIDLSSCAIGVTSELLRDRFPTIIKSLYAAEILMALGVVNPSLTSSVWHGVAAGYPSRSLYRTDLNYNHPNGRAVALLLCSTLTFAIRDNLKKMKPKN